MFETFKCLTREDVEEKLVELGLFKVGRKITDYEMVHLCSSLGLNLSGSIEGETQCYNVGYNLDTYILVVASLP